MEIFIKIYIKEDFYDKSFKRSRNMVSKSYDTKKLEKKNYGFRKRKSRAERKIKN